jgi:hypothetical protein
LAFTAKVNFCRSFSWYNNFVECRHAKYVPHPAMHFWVLGQLRLDVRLLAESHARKMRAQKIALLQPALLEDRGLEARSLEVAST